MPTNSQPIMHVAIWLALGITHALGDDDTSLICVKEAHPLGNKQIHIPSRPANFQEFVGHSGVFVDKTLFIKEFLSNDTTNGNITSDDENCKFIVSHFPRKCGQSMILGMLKEFLQPVMKNGMLAVRNETWAYRFFAEGAVGASNRLKKPPKISKEDYIIENYLGKCPLISITFSVLNYRNEVGMLASLEQLVRVAFLQQDYMSNYFRKIVNSGNATVQEKSAAQADLKFIEKYGSHTPKDEKAVIGGLCGLAGILRKIFNRKAFLLIDDFDKAYSLNYKYHLNSKHPAYTANKMSALLEKFLSKTSKECAHIEKILAVGVSEFGTWHIGKAVNFRRSLNVLNNTFSEYYSFSEEEVKQLLKETDQQGSMQSVRLWYKGYYLGLQRSPSYNIYSIVNFANKREIGNYWEQTNKAVNLFKWLFVKNLRHMFLTLLTDRHLLVGNHLLFNYEDGKLFHRLYSINLDLDSGVRSLKIFPDKLETFREYLLTTGYLTLNESATSKQEGTRYYTRLPNNEIRSEILDHFHNYQSHLTLKATSQEVFKSTSEDVSHYIRQFLSQNERNEKWERCLTTLYGYLAPFFFPTEPQRSIGDYDGNEEAITDLLYASFIVSAAYLKLRHFEGEYVIHTVYIGNKVQEFADYRPSNLTYNSPDIVVYGHENALAVEINYSWEPPTEEEKDKYFFKRIINDEVVSKDYALFFDSLGMTFKSIKALSIFVLQNGTCYFQYKFIR